MVNKVELLLKSYERLVSLTEQQLNILNNDLDVEQLDEIFLLEQKKLIDQDLIQDLQTSDTYSLLNDEQRNQTILTVIQLQSLTEKLRLLIKEWQVDNSLSMKQVSVHRKTLQTYGGINYSDVISYYLDEKQ